MVGQGQTVHQTQHQADSSQVLAAVAELLQKIAGDDSEDADRLRGTLRLVQDEAQDVWVDSLQRAREAAGLRDQDDDHSSARSVSRSRSASSSRSTDSYMSQSHRWSISAA